MAFLEVAEVEVSIGERQVLKGISFSQQRHQKIALAGETGSGKSTLLKSIAGLVQQDSGKIVYKDNRVEGPAEKLVPGHKEIAYLSQQFELPKFLRVEQVLDYASELDSEEEEKLYRICHIDHVLDRKTDELSGGERQRVALARLLSGKPELLLLDEPFSNLDMHAKNVMQKVVNNLANELSITTILVSHDPEDSLSWADHILILRDGKVIQQGSPHDIYHAPVNEYVAGLFGKFNLLSPGQARKLFGKSINREIIRPEDISVSKNKIKGSVACSINKVTFFGGYDMLLVECATVSLEIKVDKGRYREGEQVFISLQN